VSAEILRTIADAFNARDWDRARELLSENVRFSDLGMGVTLEGADAFLGYAQSWAGAFSDMRLEVRAAVGDDQTVAGEFSGTGTHDGPLPSPDGKEIPGTGRRMEEPFTWFCDVSGGKLTSIRDYYNPMSIMTQLGLMEGAPG
jgi:steroid delta-isomerase-like uncharacterized protein